jgi:hypothetical protein
MKDTDILPLFLIVCCLFVLIYNTQRITLLSHELDKVKMVQQYLQKKIEETNNE